MNISWIYPASLYGPFFLSILLTQHTWLFGEHFKDCSTLMIFSRIILRLWKLRKPIFGKHKLISSWNVNLFSVCSKPSRWECISQGQTKWLKEGKPLKLQPPTFKVVSYQTPAQPINQGQASIRQKAKGFSWNQTKNGRSNVKF